MRTSLLHSWEWNEQVKKWNGRGVLLVRSTLRTRVCRLVVWSTSYECDVDVDVNESGRGRCCQRVCYGMRRCQHLLDEAEGRRVWSAPGSGVGFIWGFQSLPKELVGVVSQ